MKRTSIFALLALLSFQGNACPQFLPANTISIPANTKALNLQGISESQFKTVIQKVLTIYSPIISNLNGNFVINGRWEFKSANAFAFRFQDKWGIEISGGLARHPLMTEDAFALTVCHEVGHLLGGVPKRKKDESKFYSNEGQADYFATLKCLRLYYLNEQNEKFLKGKAIPTSVSSGCRKAYSSKADQLICLRSGLAALQAGEFLAAVEKSAAPKLETPDLTVVSQTRDEHPEAQCRVDTLWQGALCDKSIHENLSETDETKGTCHPSNGDTVGLRPSCWFRPTAYSAR